DGRVGAIRAALDDDGFSETPILAYSAKFASAFYGPFREAADSTPAFGDRRPSQMDPANGEEAVREARLDVEEGADMLMVKPALPYLDVIRRVKDETGMPLAPYPGRGGRPGREAARPQAPQPQARRGDRARRPGQAPAQPDAGQLPDLPPALSARRERRRDHRA